MARLSDATIAQIKADYPIDEIVGRRVKLGRPNGRGVCAGQCLCEPVRGKQPLWVHAGRGTFGCLRPNGCGGDLFAFLEQFEGLDFAAAVRALGGGDAVRDETALAELQAKRDAAKAARQAREAAVAEQERSRAFEIWQGGIPAAGTLVDAYFEHRSLLPRRSRALRFSEHEPFYAAGEHDGDRPRIIHRGPCMLAAIQGPDGKFCGVHRTWLDADMATPSGKAAILLPDGSPADVKKMRGLKKRGAIRLRDCGNPEESFDRVLLIGEGIETTATVLEALENACRDGVDYYAWAAGDLGNIAGGGLGTSTKHPTRQGLWVPPSEPDMMDPGVVPPAWVSRVILLGDGDSDPETTKARLECARRRFDRLGFPTAVSMAPSGLDFNDLGKQEALSL